MRPTAPLHAKQRAKLVDQGGSPRRQQQQQREGLRPRWPPQPQQAPSSAPRHVTFLPGPLPTVDGHPVTEGTLAKKPALDGGYMVCESTPQPTRLTKKEVLDLEQLLTEQGPGQYTASIAKLKMRVGLLPQQSPPRPYAAAKAAAVGKGQQECRYPAAVHAAQRKRERE